MLWYILLYASIHVCCGVRMPLTRKNLRGIFSNGDIILGGIFPIHITALEDHPLFRGHPRVFVCKMLKPIQLQWAMTMVFAIDEINKDDSLLPNVTLGYFIFDSCFSITKLMEYVLTEIRKNIETSDINEESYSPAIVGPFNSEFSKNLNNILSLFSVPQISYAASCKCLGNKKQFPSFLRTYPNNIFRIPAVIGLVKHFDWMYVGIMNVDDEFGKTFAADFGTEAEKENICLAFHLDWPQVYEERHLVKLANVLARTKAKIVFVLWYDKDAIPIAKVLLAHNVSGITWLGVIIMPSSIISPYNDVFRGSIGFEARHAHIPGLYEFLINRHPQIKDIDGDKTFQKKELRALFMNQKENMFKKSDINLKTTRNCIEWDFKNLNTADVRNFCLSVDWFFNSSNQSPIFDKNNDNYFYDNCKNIDTFTDTNYPVKLTKPFKCIKKYEDSVNRDHKPRKPKAFNLRILRCCLEGKNGIKDVCEENKTTDNVKFKTYNVLNKEHCDKMFEPQSSEIISHFSSHYLPNLMQLHGSIEQSQSIFINEFWEKTFECTLTTKAKEIQPCMGNESLKEVTTPFTEVSQLFLPFNIYKAVYAIAHALHDMTTCIMGNGPFENGSCTDIHNLWTWQLLFYIRNVNFVLKMREEIFQFDDNGDPPAIYDLVNWQTDDNGEMHLERVGSFDATARPGQELFINTSSIQWNEEKHKVPRSVCSEPCQPGTRKVSLKGEPFCCFDCIPCTDGHYSNTTDSQECQNCPEDLWSNKQRSTCLPMPREFLSFSDPLALTLLAFSALGFTMAVIVWIMIFKYHELIVSQSARSVLHFILLTSLASSCVSNVMFVGEPTDLSCQWRESLAVYLIAFSIIAVLTRVCDIIMHSQVPQTWDLAAEYYQPKVLMVLCSLPQTGFCVAWAVLGKLQRHKNIESRLGTIVLECIGASPLWVSCALFYLGILAISCFVMALKGRKLAPDCSEPKFIIFSMLFFFMVLIAFIPAYSSTQGKFAVATEMFAIMAICYGFLGCIFFPKCYLIALKIKK